MATKINLPASVRSATWYTQYQETSASIANILPKKFGISKRTAGIPAATLISGGKATNIRTQYSDVNGGGLPLSQVWNTLRIAEVNGLRATVSKPINTTIANNTTYTDEISGTAARVGDIPASYNHAGISNNGNTTGWQFYQGFSYNITIPSDGVVRIQITNNSGAAVSISGKYIFSDIYKSKQELADFVGAVYANKDSPTFAEFAENGMPYNKVEEVFEAIYNKIKNDSGGAVTSPADTELYADYFAGINGFAGGPTLNSGSMSDARNILSSQANARGNLGYYSAGAFNYRNRLVGGYFNGINIMFNGSFVYSTIFDIEKEFVAMPDRKVGVFGWGAFEGVAGGIDGAMWQRLPIQGGDVIRLSRAQGSFEMTQMQGFLAMLLGNTYVLWNDNSPYGTNINCWGPAFIGGDDPWKTRWQPTGGVDVQYDPNNPTHPKRDPNCNGGFSDSAADNLNGAFAGVWFYSQIKDRSNQKIKYATFSYTDNGTTKTGYASGNTPVLGSKGDASVSTFNNANYGQHNIVNQWEAKKPIVFECIGTGGTAIVIINLYAGLTESSTYTINTQNHGTQTITHVGKGLGVYTIGAAGGGQPSNNAVTSFLASNSSDYGGNILLNVD